MTDHRFVINNLRIYIRDLHIVVSNICLLISVRGHPIERLSESQALKVRARTLLDSFPKLTDDIQMEAYEDMAESAKELLKDMKVFCDSIALVSDLLPKLHQEIHIVNRLYGEVYENQS